MSWSNRWASISSRVLRIVGSLGVPAFGMPAGVEQRLTAVAGPLGGSNNTPAQWDPALI
ncbi:MAG: hypothetical protein ABIY38_09370 [Rhodococcus sp. (in: high G+C Gram-positive bacteria)]